MLNLKDMIKPLKVTNTLKMKILIVCWLLTYWKLSRMLT